MISDGNVITDTVTFLPVVVVSSPGSVTEKAISYKLYVEEHREDVMHTGR